MNVGLGSIDTDGFEEILTTPGPGPFGPNVKGWNYDFVAISAIQKVNFQAINNPSGGGKVAGGDVDDDQMEEIIVESLDQVAGFNYDGVQVTALPGFSTTGHGIGAGDVGDVPGDDLLLGESTTSDVNVLEWDGSTLSPFVSFTAFAGSTQVTMAGGDLGL